MKNIKKWLPMIASLLLVFAMVPLYASAGLAASVPQNYVQNDSFENGLTDWSASGDTAAVQVKAHDAETGTNALNYWAGASFNFTVSQTVYGLPDGQYSLSASTQGGGGENISRIFARNYGMRQSANLP